MTTVWHAGHEFYLPNVAAVQSAADGPGASTPAASPGQHPPS